MKITYVHSERAAAIRKLNDRFRMQRRGGFYRLSGRVFALAHQPYEEVQNAIRSYDGFDHNNPLDKHDCGTIELHGETYVWEIVYFGKGGCGESPDPCNPAVTMRCMTISLRSEQ